MRELYNSGEFTEADRDKVDSEAGGNGLPPLEPRSDRCYLPLPLPFFSKPTFTHSSACHSNCVQTVARQGSFLLGQTVVLYTQADNEGILNR